MTGPAERRRPADRPGPQTSEFKLTVLAVLAGIALVALGLWKDRDALVNTGALVVTGATGVYAAARSITKRSST